MCSRLEDEMSFWVGPVIVKFARLFINLGVSIHLFSCAYWRIKVRWARGPGPFDEDERVAKNHFITKLRREKGWGVVAGTSWILFGILEPGYGRSQQRPGQFDSSNISYRSWRRQNQMNYKSRNFSSPRTSRLMWGPYLVKLKFSIETDT